MKSPDEVRDRIELIAADLEEGASYGGPDPSPKRTDALQTEVKVLNWVLGVNKDPATRLK